MKQNPMCAFSKDKKNFFQKIFKNNFTCLFYMMGVHSHSHHICQKGQKNDYERTPKVVHMNVYLCFSLTAGLTSNTAPRMLVFSVETDINFWFVIILYSIWIQKTCNIVHEYGQLLWNVGNSAMTTNQCSINKIYWRKLSMKCIFILSQ